jgi:HSP20 family protein
MDSDVKQFFAELAETDEFPGSSLNTNTHGEDDELRASDAESLGDEREGQLAIDVYERGAHIIVEAPVAGVNSDDIDIHITNESLTIRGKRHREHTVREKDYFFQECYWGRFSRSLMLPEEVDADRAQATIKNGVLRITMPKLHHAKR